MFTDYFPRSIEDISWFFFDASFEKFLHRNLSDKTKSLRIFAFSIGETCFFRDLADFGFQEMSDRKKRFGDLKGRETREEIGLVFRGIESLH